MCIGIPMQVLAASNGLARCADGAGGLRQVRTSLLGEVRPGDWVLVFQMDAVERIDAQRAQEVLATLALVQGAMSGAGADGAAAFELPSATPQAALTHLAG